MSKKFAVLGYPIGHSLSPLLHNEIFRMKNLPYSYEAILMPPEKLKEEFPRLIREYAGFNCTIPLKETVIPLLDNVHPSAAELGSVNTVICGESVRGFSTDTEGFLRSLAMHSIYPDGKRVLIVGGGGVARVIAIACAKKGCRLTIAVRSPEKMTALCDEIKNICGNVPIVTTLDCIEGEFDLLVQCTPLGMYPKTDACPVSDDVISRCDAVFDTVYNPLKTLILEKAEGMGKTALSGLEMLVFQGLASEEIWLGLTFTNDETAHLISLLEKKLKEAQA